MLGISVYVDGETAEARIRFLDSQTGQPYFDMSFDEWDALVEHVVMLKARSKDKIKQAQAEIAQQSTDPFLVRSYV